jgi:streptogramin lyase
MHYQWQYQPSGSLTWVNVTDDGTNNGSQTSILIINPAVLAMNGKPFHCVATNLWGCCTSTPVTLTVSVNNSTPVYLGTLAGMALTSGNEDGANTNALFNHPCGIAVDSHTNIYVADMYNDVIRKVSLSGTNWVVATIAGLAGNSGSADGTGTNSRLNAPYGIVVGIDGNVYVSDTYNQTIRQLTPSGTNWVVSTIAGLVGTKNTNDGSSARFNLPIGLAADKTGCLYVADEGNSSIRKMTFNGAYWTVSTLAGGSFGSNDGTNRTAQFGKPYGITVNASGTVVSVADSYFNTIRQLTSSGTNWLATTIAGKSSISGSTDGIGSTARFNNPAGIAVGADGNLYVADCGNNTIRRLTPVGTNWNVFTIAGLAGSSGSVDGIGSNVRLNGPFGIAVDNSTNLYVSDSINNTIRGTVVLSGASPLIVNMTGQNVQAKTLAISWNAASGQTYQVQYKSSLNQTAWSNLTTVTASNWTGNATIPVGTDPQRFYRVISQ